MNQLPASQETAAEGFLFFSALRDLGSPDGADNPDISRLVWRVFFFLKEEEEETGSKIKAEGSL